MAPKTNTPPKHGFSADIIRKKLAALVRWGEVARIFAQDLDWLGAASAHPEGSEQRALAEVRDGVDLALGRFAVRLGAEMGIRAETTWSRELLMDAAVNQEGNGQAALRLIRRYHALFGDESVPGDMDIGGTLAGGFAWETYVRVLALAHLAEELPRHLRTAARQMHGWPMIVTQHLDHRAEFMRLAAVLELGADYPLSAGPRKKRGTETLLLRYLDPLVWRLHQLRGFLVATAENRQGEDFAQRIHGLWWELPAMKPKPEMLAILRLLPALPPLTRRTAAEWSRRVIVPIRLPGTGAAEHLAASIGEKPGHIQKPAA